MKRFFIFFALNLFVSSIVVGQNISYKKYKTWNDFILFQNNAIAGLKIGMTKNQVLDSIGRNPSKIAQTITGELMKDVIPQPLFRDVWKSDDLDLEIMWIYTQTKNANGILDKNECTPIFFNNEILKGIGLPMLEDFVQKNKLPLSLLRN